MNTALKVFGLAGLIMGGLYLANSPNSPIADDIARATSSLATPPVTSRLSHYKDQYNDNMTLILTSVIDSIEIQNVTVNRGNCGYTWKGNLYETSSGDLTTKTPGTEHSPTTATLKFGEELKFFICLNPIEAVVKTNLGQWTFTFPSVY
jgi:hypothetical protein